MIRRIILITLTLCLSLTSFSRRRGNGDKAPGPEEDTISVDIDTSYLKRYNTINDYSMVGIQYGVALSKPSFSPERTQQQLFVPIDAGILYTHYGKLFGYMPYFGIQLGAFYTQEGYRFKENRENNYIDNILGASKAVYTTVEIPAMAHLHFDLWKFKIMVNVGPYAGYRLKVSRSEYQSDSYREFFKEYENNFHGNEYRWTYGLRAGAGVALILDPLEFHISATYKYCWGLLHKPNVNSITLEDDANSKYYYKWANPTSIILSFGIHYQLTRRNGLTRKTLKREAYQQAKIMYDQVMKESVAKEGDAVPEKNGDGLLDNHEAEVKKQ